MHGGHEYGYLTRVEQQGAGGYQLRLIGYDGTVYAVVNEPATLAFTTLIGCTPP